MTTVRQARFLGALFALLIVAASGVYLLTATATAQTGGNNSSTGIQIDTDLTLLESTYNDSSGYATLRFEADKPMSVTLVDRGEFDQDGPVNRVTRTIEADGPQEVRINVTESRGRTGVSIDTGPVLFAHTISREDTSAKNPLAQTGPLESWLGGALAIASMTTLAAYRRLNADPDEPEEIR